MKFKPGDKVKVKNINTVDGWNRSWIDAIRLSECTFNIEEKPKQNYLWGNYKLVPVFKDSIRENVYKITCRNYNDFKDGVTVMASNVEHHLELILRKKLLVRDLL